jgi:hypothetical protein
LPIGAREPNRVAQETVAHGFNFSYWRAKGGSRDDHKKVSKQASAWKMGHRGIKVKEKFQLCFYKI